MNDATIPTLTVWQPWATLIAEGFKPYEFRGWPAPRSLIGKRIAIHAGARPVRKDEVRQLLLQLQSSFWRESGLDRAPSDWIKPLPGDAFALATGWEDTDDEPEAPQILQAAEQVAFRWVERHGTATLTIETDRTWTVDRDPPPECNHIWAPFDFASMHRDMADFTAFMVRTEELGDYQIDYATWSDEDVVFRFEDGRFVEVGP